MAVTTVHTYCVMCVSRCGVIATVEDGRFTKVTADPDHPNGCICVKGTAAPDIVSHPIASSSPWSALAPRPTPTPVGAASPGTRR